MVAEGYQEFKANQLWLHRECEPILHETLFQKKKKERKKRKEKKEGKEAKHVRKLSAAMRG